MMRVYNFSRFSALWALILVPVFIFVGLPLVLALVGLVIIGNLVRSLLVRPRASSFDPNVSPVIENKEIGPYRIKRHQSDPSVIEVLD